MSSLFDRFKTLDFMAPDIVFNIDGNRKVRTIPGLIVMTLYLFMLTAAAVYSFEDYFKTSSPDSFSELVQKDEYPYVNLGSNNILPVFIGYLGDTDMITSDNMAKYLTFEVTRQTWTAKPDETGVVKTSVEETYLETIACNKLTVEELKHYDYMQGQSYMYSQMMTYGICIRPHDNFFVKGRVSDEEYDMIAYKLKPCVLGAGQCGTLEEIGSINYFLVMPETNLDQSLFDNPLKIAPNMDAFYYVNPSASQIAMGTVKTNSISDYLGLIPQWQMKKLYYDMKDIKVSVGYRDSSVQCTPDQIGPNNTGGCTSYFEFWIMSSGTTSTLRRKYKTLVETFGEIGGVQSVMYIILSLLYIQYNKYAREKYLLNRLYPFLNTHQPNQVIPGQINGTFPSGEHEDSIPKSSLHCCCRKQKKSDLKVMRECGVDALRAALDVVNIVKMFERVKLLSAIVLSKDQTNILSWIDLLNRKNFKLACIGKSKQKFDEFSFYDQDKGNQDPATNHLETLPSLSPKENMVSVEISDLMKRTIMRSLSSANQSILITRLTEAKLQKPALKLRSDKNSERKISTNANGDHLNDSHDPAVNEANINQAKPGHRVPTSRFIQVTLAKTKKGKERVGSHVGNNGQKKYMQSMDGGIGKDKGMGKGERLHKSSGGID